MSTKFMRLRQIQGENRLQNQPRCGLEGTKAVAKRLQNDPAAQQGSMCGSQGEAVFIGAMTRRADA
jgi:hypothetical protein